MVMARPELDHPRIVLAGCPKLPDGDGDDAHLVAALRGRGLHARWLAWDDPAVADADLVILRATWDYIERLDEFLAWAAGVPALLNPMSVVGWNTDKSYLVDLQRAGVPTVPTVHLGPQDALTSDAVRFDARGEVVVKPSVGAGSAGARRFTDLGAAQAHAADLQRAGRGVIVQPYDARVDDDGETALVFLGGRPSHAFTKGAMLPAGGGAAPTDPTGTFAEETLAAAEPGAAAWDVGRDALDAAAAHLGLPVEELLYARVDVIGGASDVRVLEVELVEPSLGWRQQTPANREAGELRFAVAVQAAVERLGLGPRAHGRP